MARVELDCNLKKNWSMSLENAAKISSPFCSLFVISVDTGVVRDISLGKIKSHRRSVDIFVSTGQRYPN